MPSDACDGFKSHHASFYKLIFEDLQWYEGERHYVTKAVQFYINIETKI